MKPCWFSFVPLDSGFGNPNFYNIALKIVCANTNCRMLNADAVVQSFVFVGILITFSSVQFMIPTPKLQWLPMLMLKVVAFVLSRCLFRGVDFQGNIFKRCHRSVKRDTNPNTTSLTSDLGRQQYPSSNKDSTSLAHNRNGNIQIRTDHHALGQQLPHPEALEASWSSLLHCTRCNYQLRMPLPRLQPTMHHPAVSPRRTALNLGSPEPKGARG